MKKKMTCVLVILLCGFVSNTASAAGSKPGLQWHAFLNGSGCNAGNGIAVDNSGNVYIVGDGNGDAFVAKFNANGVMQWITFLGGSEDDSGSNIAVDSLGNIYVAGTSKASWGNPLQPFAGSANAFVAKITADGNLQWNTFLGTSAKNINKDISGNINVLIYFPGSEQIVKFDASGNILNAVLIPRHIWDGQQVNLDRSGNLFSTGYWTPSMESCIHGIVSACNADGSYKWGDYFGCEGDTEGNDIMADSSGSAYVTGISDCNFATDFSIDAFIAKFSQWRTSDEADMKWITYLGGNDQDSGSAIAIDDNLNTFVAGSSKSSWGKPLRTFSGMKDIFVAKVNENGELQWNTFLGGSEDDNGKDIAVDNLGNIYVLGTSNSSWGDPLYPFSGSSDVFLAKLTNSITVTSPGGGEIWAVKTNQPITWLRPGVQNANVKIALFKDTNTLVKMIATPTPNDGAYNWLVPATLVTGSNYFIRVRTVDNLVSDYSEKFSIIVPAITVTAPSLGAVWVKNGSKTVTWNTIGTQDANVKIQLYRGTAKFLDIMPSTPNKGTYDWQIPSNLANALYTIRITTLDGKVKGISKSFTIATGLIKVTAPAIGDKWQRGIAHTITWTGEGTLNANVKIQLLRGTEISTIIASTANDGNYEWTIPANKALANYRIRVTTVDNLVKGESGAFTITNSTD